MPRRRGAAGTLREVGLERENRIPMADRGLMVTCGANQAFAHAMLALCDAGDEVVLFAPYYFSHLVALQMFGLRPRILPCEAASGVPSLGALRGALDDAGGRVRAVVLVSPGNPSGTIVPEALGRAVLRECAARGVWLVTDEAYEHFTFGGDADGGAIPHASLAAPPTTPAGNADVDASERECVVSLFTFSKSYGMAGWRVGYLVYPRRLDGALLKVQDTLLTHAPLYCQRLALAALRDLGTPWVRAQVASLAPAREALWRAVAPLFELRRAATGGAPTPRQGAAEPRRLLLLRAGARRRAGGRGAPTPRRGVPFAAAAGLGLWRSGLPPPELRCPRGHRGGAGGGAARGGGGETHRGAQ